MLKPGLYEQVINQEIKTELAETSEDQKLSQKIDAAEASDILTGYISEVIKKRLDMISDGENVSAQVELVNKIVNVLSGEAGDEVSELAVAEDAEQLIALLPDKKLDVFMVTLNKSDKDYSPTTMYEDYSINEELFHWQSQNATSDTSPTGQRYINHKKMGSDVLLFVREFKKDELGTAPYTFLGTATYMRHIGNKPMSITWHLDDAIPAKYLKKTNKLVVG